MARKRAKTEPRAAEITEAEAAAVRDGAKPATPAMMESMAAKGMVFSVPKKDISIPKSEPERLILVNRARSSRQFNLPHDVCCSGVACYCTTIEMLVTVANPATGGVGKKPVAKRCDGSITLLAGGRAEVTRMQARAPDILAAERRGEVAFESA